MRTVKRQSVKLNQGKFERLERLARAFAQDKQLHLDFYQAGLTFSEVRDWKSRRTALKITSHHDQTPLAVHASDLAVKEAFETELKDWAAVAARIHPRIGSRAWTDEQKHDAYWSLCDARRFAALILGRAPIQETISWTLAHRKQAQNYLRRQARRMMGARPRVKNARSFALDATLYSVGQTPRGQVLAITSLEKGERIALPLTGAGEVTGKIRIGLV